MFNFWSIGGTVITRKAMGMKPKKGMTLRDVVRGFDKLIRGIRRDRGRWERAERRTKKGRNG